MKFGKREILGILELNCFIIVWLAFLVKCGWLICFSTNISWFSSDKYRVRFTFKKNKKLFLLQTEEEFLEALTEGFPDESVEGDEEEDESDESEEERDEEQGEKSQNGGRRQSLPLPLERRVVVASMASALQQEGETFLKYFINE